MKKSSSSRRVPRVIGQNEDDEESVTTSEHKASGSGPVVVRPVFKSRKPSTLRNQFGPSVVDEDEDSNSSSVITPKRSKPSKIGLHRNTANRSSNLSTQHPLRNFEVDEDRPSYNLASLQELKNSTPTTPLEHPDSDLVETTYGVHSLDIASKFGSSLSRYQHASAIPSAAEIAEKKARRKRLALEEKAEEFISLNPSDPELDDDENVTRDEYGRLVLKPKDKYGNAQSRLVREDEDVMENFDEFTEDGRMLLGRKAEMEAAKRRKEEMAAQIAAAEQVSDSDSDASERERNEAFEAAQTKHGTYGQDSTQSDPDANIRPTTPPIISPLLSVDSVLESLRSQLSEMEVLRMKKFQEKEALQSERMQVAEEELRIQKTLKETAEKFEQLRKEKGIIHENVSTVATAETTLPASDSSDDEPPAKTDEMDVDEDAERGGFAGLGYGGMRRGLGAAGPGMAAMQESDSDDY